MKFGIPILLFVILAAIVLGILVFSAVKGIQ